MSPIPILPQNELPILSQYCNKIYWTLITQNYTIQNNSKHIVAYHICKYTLEFSNPGTTFGGTENEELAFPDTENSDRKEAFLHPNMPHKKCSARRAV